MNTSSLLQAPLQRPLVLVHAEFPADLAKRLGTLGFRRGAQLKALAVTSGGGRIIAVAGARIALDKAVLASMEVEEA